MDQLIIQPNYLYRLLIRKEVFVATDQHRKSNMLVVLKRLVPIFLTKYFLTTPEKYIEFICYKVEEHLVIF